MSTAMAFRYLVIFDVMLFFTDDFLSESDRKSTFTTGEQCDTLDLL